MLYENTNLVDWQTGEMDRFLRVNGCLRSRRLTGKDKKIIHVKTIFVLSLLHSSGVETANALEPPDLRLKFTGVWLNAGLR